MKKLCTISALIFALAFIIFGCGGGDSGNIKIGLIAELTGDMPAVGASCKNAAEMAVAEINSAGGIQLGEKKYKVDLIIEDNAGKADQSASSAQ
jgi:branched-chain amino acid transport system substrate-binding protein